MALGLGSEGPMGLLGGWDGARGGWDGALGKCEGLKSPEFIPSPDPSKVEPPSCHRLRGRKRSLELLFQPSHDVQEKADDLPMAKPQERSYRSAGALRGRNSYWVARQRWPEERQEAIFVQGIGVGPPVKEKLDLNPQSQRSNCSATVLRPRCPSHHIPETTASFESKSHRGVSMLGRVVESGDLVPAQSNTHWTCVARTSTALLLGLSLWAPRACPACHLAQHHLQDSSPSPQCRRSSRRT